MVRLLYSLAPEIKVQIISSPEGWGPGRFHCGWMIPKLEARAKVPLPLTEKTNRMIDCTTPLLIWHDMMSEMNFIGVLIQLIYVFLFLFCFCMKWLYCVFNGIIKLYPQFIHTYSYQFNSFDESLMNSINIDTNNTQWTDDIHSHATMTWPNNQQIHGETWGMTHYIHFPSF